MQTWESVEQDLRPPRRASDSALACIPIAG